MEAFCTVQTLRNSCKFFSESDKKKKKKKNWLEQSQKKSGERSRATLALLLKIVRKI